MRSSVNLTQHNVDNHRFYSNGEIYYPSPTTILKLYFDPMFRYWSQDQNNLNYRNQRAIVGSRVHAIVNHRLLSEPFESHPMDQGFGIPTMSKITEDFLRQSEIILSECQVFTPALRIAGTFDYVVRDTQGYSLIDLKTVDNPKKRKSKAVLKGHFMQLAAYHAGLKHCYPELPITRWQCLVVSPADIRVFEVTDKDEMIAHIKYFQALRKEYLIKYNK